MIRLENIRYKYDSANKFALEGVNLSIKEGEFVGITGAGGAGKTTLLRIINGVIPHCFGGEFYGSAVVMDKDTFSVTLSELSKYIGSVLDDIDSQFVTATVEDEILFGLENFGIPNSEISDRISEALRVVGIEALRNREIASLSGGQKQKTAIAAAAALKPKLLILDEPTGELDPKSSRMIYEMLLKMNKELGITVIVAEQKIMLLSEYADRLIVLDKGKILYDDNVRAVLENYKDLKRIGINCPRVVTLFGRLSDEGLYKGDIPVSVDEAEKTVKSEYLAKGDINEA